MTVNPLPSYTVEIYRGWRIRKLYGHNDKGELGITGYYISNVKAGLQSVAYDTVEEVRYIIDEHLGDRDKYRGKRR